jgi:hypothetical protein
MDMLARRVALSLTLLLLGACHADTVPSGAGSGTAGGSSSSGAARAAAPPPGGDVARSFCEGPSSFPLEVAGSRHFVGVTLAGPKATETVRFHVDTGGNTPGLMIRRETADRLGFAAESALPRALRIDGRDLPVPEGARWSIGDEPPDRPVTDASTRKGWSGGQLGAGFLSRFTICIDPGRGRIALATPGSVALPPPGGSIPVMMMPGGENRALYPFVQVLLTAGGSFTGGYGVLLDTGATTSMLDAKKIEYQARKNPGWPVFTGAAGDADMLGGAFPERLIRAEDVRITAPKAKYPDRPEIDAGPATFVSRPDGTWDRMFGSVPFTMGSHGAIANDVLNRFRIILDYRDARLWLMPSGRPADRSASMVRVGLALRFGADGCPVVRQIASANAKDTLAAIQPGDVLLKIDGKDVCKLWHHEIQAELAGSAGQTKNLELRRGGASVAVTVTVADLFAGSP